MLHKTSNTAPSHERASTSLQEPFRFQPSRTLSMCLTTAVLCCSAVAIPSALAQNSCPEVPTDTVPNCSGSFAWSDFPNPGFPLSRLNVPTFDGRNRPYVRQRNGVVNDIPGYVDTLLPTGWQAWDFRDAVASYFGVTRDDVNTKFGASKWPTEVVFDQDGHAYTAARFQAPDDPENHDAFLLLYSTDYCETWQVYELPLNPLTSTQSGFEIEKSYSPDPLEGTPAILLYQQEGQLDVCKPTVGLGQTGTLKLLIPKKTPGGGLQIDPNTGLLDGVVPVDVSSVCLGIQQSGGANRVLTHQQKTYVAWIETRDHGAECQPENTDTPTYYHVYDRAAGAWVGSPRQLTGMHSRPANDNHNMPGIAMEPSGRLHVVTGAHNEQLWHAVRDPISELWTICTVPCEDCNSACDDNSTYVSMVIDSSNTLHVTYRRLHCPPLIENPPVEKWFELVYTRRLASGVWSSPQPLDPLVCPGWSNYTSYLHQLSVDRYDRLYLSFSFLAEAQNPPLPLPLDPRGLLFSADSGDTWKVLVNEDFGYWVEFDHPGQQRGSFKDPHSTLQAGVNGVVNGGTLSLMADAPGETAETITINKPMILNAPLGTVRIGVLSP